MISLWLDEGVEEALDDMKKEESQKKKKGTPCACGRAVCCGKHKRGQCSCSGNQKERS